MIYFSVFLLSFIFEVTNSLNWAETKLFFMSVSPKCLARFWRNLPLCTNFHDNTQYWKWPQYVLLYTLIIRNTSWDITDGKLSEGLKLYNVSSIKNHLKILTVSSGSKWPKAQAWQQRELKVLFFPVIMTQWKSMGNKKLLGIGLK